MSKNSDTILKVLKVISWALLIGLCVNSGVLIFNFVLTLFKPVASHDIYKGLNLSEMYENNFPHFIGMMSFVVVLSILKAYLFFLVARIFQKLNLVKPFDAEIAKLIERISIEASFIALIGIIAKDYTTRLIHSGYEVSSIGKYWDDSMAILMMAGIIFIIAQIFKKGIELQNENDLTV
jgi:hypothetical protein